MRDSTFTPKFCSQITKKNILKSEARKKTTNAQLARQTEEQQ